VSAAGDPAELVLPGKVVGSLGSAGMFGSSIAAPTAALWVTDFLNAAYYARRDGERTLDDLRLARAILATAWHRADYRRLTARDLVGFHRAFGRDRFRADGPAARGRLNGEELLAGAERMFGAWFGAAAQDPERRGWGVVFEDEPHLVHRDEAGTFGAAGEEEWMTFFRDPAGNLLVLVSRH